MYVRQQGQADENLVNFTMFRSCEQGCGSGSQLDLDSMGSVDPDPESGSGFRRAKMTPHK
jgi:hypothetical protein